MTDDRVQRIDPRYNPEFQRGYEPGAGPSRARVESPPASPGPVPDVAPEEHADANGVEPVRRGFNPYFAALWVLAVVCVAGGVLVSIWSTIANFEGMVQGPVDRVVRTMQVVAYFAGPATVTVGLLTIAGLIFVAAVRGSGRSR
ncbi:hypothetical protein [Lacisediminihabitans profunda]|uniref:Uncharacterized protein n=1 Tax=Lacisediminihabitans profunda TaxID=2594790 RepID=A0A5C8UM95_9MICO|nr:hypothetical protein [Lacisediminihabitans profunda]TXN29453.1 hypothetical protein FVP33_14905 [Lacisediminihabitans profunda]